LRAVSGPTAASFLLQPPGPLTIGRRSTNPFHLNDPAVSREHARLTFRARHERGQAMGGEWLLDDLGSIHGTWLNGVKIKEKRQYHLRAGDLLVIGPWTLLVADRDNLAQPGTTLATLDDTAMVGTIVARIEPGDDGELTAEALGMLYRCSQQIHEAACDANVAQAVIDTAIEGTPFTRIAMLRPLTHDEQVEVVAFRTDDQDESSPPRLSRVLIREASSGSPARLLRGPIGNAQPDSADSFSQIVTLCIPIIVGTTLAGYLYLDRPQQTPPTGRKPSSLDLFPTALARLAALGMAKLMRIDIEKRRESMEVELEAAVEAQRWLLPQRQGETASFSHICETRHGRFIGGDFFDIIPVGSDRLAVVLGDVGGRGIPVSILVSASQGFLHARLLENAAPEAAVRAINDLYLNRIAHARFLKLWIGVFDSRARTLDYVDAGHGFAMMVRPDGTSELLPSGNQLAAGAKTDAEYRTQTAPLLPGHHIVIVSDGVVGQREHLPSCDPGDEPPTDAHDDRPQAFGLSRVFDCLNTARSGDDEVAALFAALEEHAGTSEFDDDATAMVIRW